MANGAAMTISRVGHVTFKPGIPYLGHTIIGKNVAGERHAMSSSVGVGVGHWSRSTHDRCIACVGMRM